jgi:hypothetical protein
MSSSESRSRPKNWLHIAEALQVDGVSPSEIKKWFVDFPTGKNKIQGMCQRYKIEYCLPDAEKIRKGLNVGAGVKNLSCEDEAILRDKIQMDFFVQRKPLQNCDLINIVHNYVNSIDDHPMKNYEWSENWCRRFLMRHNVQDRLQFGCAPSHRCLSWELVLNEFGKQRVAQLGLKFDGTTPPSTLNLLHCQKMMEKVKMKKISAANKSAQIRTKRNIAKRKASPEYEPFQFEIVNADEEPLSTLFEVVTIELLRLGYAG